MIKKVMDTIIGVKEEKKEYKEYKRRIEILPLEYKNAMKSIEKYMLSYSKDGTMLKTLYDILEMFEERLSENKNIEELVGKDVTVFCDEILKEIPEKTWMDNYKNNLKKKINKKQ